MKAARVETQVDPTQEEVDFLGKEYTIPDEYKEVAGKQAVAVANTMQHSIEQDPPVICRRIAIADGVKVEGKEETVVPAWMIAELAGLVLNRRGFRNVTYDTVEDEKSMAEEQTSGAGKDGTANPDRDVILTYWAPVNHDECEKMGKKRARKVAEFLTPPSAVSQMTIDLYGKEDKNDAKHNKPASVIMHYLILHLESLIPDGLKITYTSEQSSEEGGPLSVHFKRTNQQVPSAPDSPVMIREEAEEEEEEEDEEEASGLVRPPTPRPQ